MKKIILYTAASMDGFIAKKDGSVGWLDIPSPTPTDYGYADFYAGIDTTLMGYKTYEQVLSFGGNFPYPTTKNYVLSRTERADTEQVTFVKGEVLDFVQSLKAQSGKNIWLIGGGQINGLFLKHQLIDEISISMIPVVLGAGLPLFGEVEMESGFELKKVKKYESGLVQLKYARKT